MSYTQWVSNGTNVSYVPKEKDTGEVITPFTTTAPGGVPNSSYAPSTYVLAASGAWIPQTVGTSVSEIRRPTAYTLLTSNPSPYFEATDTSLVYDSDTNHLTTNGRFVLQGLIAQNDASFKFSSFQTKAQTWTSATLNISRNYASTRWTSGTEARYYLSTDGGTNWTLLLTDDYDNDPVTVTIFSHTLATSNPSSLSNYQVKVEIDAFSSGALGSVGVLDLQLYDIWIEGIYTVSGGTGTVTSITTTGANGVTISGGSTQTITTSGTFALALGNITPTSISTGTGSFSGDVEFAASIKSPNGSNSPIVISPDGTGDLHVNADSLRLGDNNADATIATNGTGDLILTTHEGSATQGIIRLYDGANGNITLTPNGTGQVQVGSDQVVTLTASQTLTNKTLSSNSVWNGNVIGSAYGGAGTVNGILKANGSGTVSAASAGTDYVTSVSVTSPVSNTGTTANPTIALASGYGDTQNPYGSKTANYFLASPNGSAGVPTWRSIVAADIPTLNQNTTGTAANVTGIVAVANGGTGLTTLTAGYIPYGNGTSAFGSSANLFWDSTNSRLGVGTNSPSEKLSIKSATGINSVTDIASLTNPSQTSAGVRVLFNNGYGNLGAISSFQLDNGAGADNGVLAFQTASDAVLSTKMTILDTGNVGIGTNNPLARLDIVGDATPNGNGLAFGHANTAGYKWIQSFASQALYINPLGNNVIFNRDGGSVGIGTVSPASKLNVSGGNVTVSAGYGIAYSADQNRIMTPEDNVSGALIAWASGGICRFLTASTERMRIDSNGNVGIGVTPSAWYPSVYTAIDVGASSCFGGYASGASGDELTFVAGNVYFNSSNTPIYKANGFATNYRQFNGVHQWFNAPSGTAGNAITFTQAMTLDASGNLGLGTSSPSAKLTVNSGANRQIYIGQNTSNTNYNAISLNGSLSDSGLMGLAGGGTGDETLYVMSQGNMVFRTVGTNERMRIDSSGNVGIGVSSTTFRLDVQGSSSGYLEAIRFKNTNSAGYLTTSWTVGSAEATIRYAPGSFFKIGPDSGDTTSPIVFATNNGTERMRIDSSQVKATVPFIGNSGTKGFGAVTTTTSTSTPTGGSSGDHYYIY